jgi:hypothetical protein
MNEPKATQKERNKRIKKKNGCFYDNKDSTMVLAVDSYGTSGKKIN